MATGKKKKKKSGAVVAIRILAVIALLLIALVGYMVYLIWCDNQLVFKNVTVELGTESLSIGEFMTDLAKPERVDFVSDPAKIDLSRVGRTELQLRHGTQTYSVVLRVEDTQAPEAEVTELCELDVTQALPEAASLVQNVQDRSQVEIYYAQEPVMPADYSDLQVSIILEDEGGNKTEKTSLFRFSGWLRDSLSLELGQTLDPRQLLMDPERDQSLVEGLDVSCVNSVGEHTITVTSGTAQESCLVTVVDTTAPQLTLQNVRRKPKETVALEDFVVSASDLSGQPALKVVGELPDCTKEGTYTITIEASDASGNAVTEEATLWVSRNMSPPQIKGANQPLTVEKNSTPDFLVGITAWDDIDRDLEITVDTSALDLTKAGTYYITYSTIDSAGNTGTAERKVIVEPDSEDGAAMVKEIAAGLPNDPEAIRDYVHDNIAYSSDQGGDDPVLHGFTKRSGDGKVHASCLKALLDEKGYETQLIWVTNETHYWLIIKTEEGWRHIDSTPSPQHERIGLATDDVRYKNLNGRNWDRSKWPACE